MRPALTGLALWVQKEPPAYDVAGGYAVFDPDASGGDELLALGVGASGGARDKHGVRHGVNHGEKRSARSTAATLYPVFGATTDSNADYDLATTDGNANYDLAAADGRQALGVGASEKHGRRSTATVSYPGSSSEDDPDYDLAAASQVRA